MRPARRADPPHRPDHSKKPRSPLQSPSPDRLPDPSAGAQSFTHSDTDISLPPIASYPTPQLGSKMTKARTAAGEGFVLLAEQAQEEEVGALLDGVHRVVDAAGPEDVHELVNLRARRA